MGKNAAHSTPSVCWLSGEAKEVNKKKEKGGGDGMKETNMKGWHGCTLQCFGMD